MTTVYVVMRSIGGYAREDDPIPKCAGVFTDEDKARIAKFAVGGQIIEKTLDQLEPGYIAHAKALGLM